MQMAVTLRGRIVIGKVNGYEQFFICDVCFYIFSCQGLAALYEKEENLQYKAELPGVYEKLLQMYER